jgi:large subunit ribosomal protein L37Ae
MARTKKVGSTGRLGARYGAKLRRRVLDIEKKRAEPNRCPACATRSLKRKAAGLWKCSKCGLLFAGGAYAPYTDAGKAARRAISQRVAGDFLALQDTDEVEEALESLEFLPNIERETESDDVDAGEDFISDDEE